MQKCEKSFSQNFSSYSKLIGFFTTSHTRRSKACICGNKPNQTKNMRSCLCLAVLITWCRTAFLRPLIHGVQKLASAIITPTKRKTWETVYVWLFLLLDAGQLFYDLLVQGSFFTNF